MATTGYQAGIETSDTQFSYGLETSWGTAPATTFQAIRYRSETLSNQRTRQRPDEISGTREAAAAVTTQETAAGSISVAWSYNTFDDLIAIALQGGTWQTETVVNGSSGDITITNTGTVVLSSTTADKFIDVAEKSWIKLSGFTNAGNNGYWFVGTKTDTTHLTVAGPQTAVTETPTGSNAVVGFSSIKNGQTFQTMYLQQKFSATMFLTYAGAYVSRMQVNGSLGNFMSGSFDIVCKSESDATSDSSTGGITAAPTGRVCDPVSGFGGIYWNEAALGSDVTEFSLSIDNAGAAADMGMGSANAAGVRGGTLTVSGTFRAYFKDFTLYQTAMAETQGRLAIIMKDPDGNAIVFTLLAATLGATITVGGPGQPVIADFTVEGSPSGSGTIVVDRLAA